MLKSKFLIRRKLFPEKFSGTTNVDLHIEKRGQRYAHWWISGVEKFGLQAGCDSCAFYVKKEFFGTKLFPKRQNRRLLLFERI